MRGSEPLAILRDAVMMARMRRAITTLLLLLVSTNVEATADGCASVIETPDGFLSLRAAPGPSFREISRLRPGDELWVDTATCEQVGGRSVCDPRWVHVTSVRRIDNGSRRYTQGWAHRRYLRFHDCED